ncbi:MAG TPA: YciI family protein [Longimicrobiaceae bacterium]|nr:YciI family protein [Longimicrobiaceae bacterium]
MRFAILRKADRETEAGALPSEELITAMGKYIEEMVQAGVMVMGEGLQPSAKGARVRFSGGKPRVIDGPFAETKELVAGFSLIEVASKEEAIEWVKRWPTIDGGGNVEIEIRPLYELEDFGEGEGVELHARLREEMAKQ